MPALASLALAFSTHSGSSYTASLLKITGKHLCIFSVVERGPPVRLGTPAEDADPGDLDFVTSSWWL